MLDNNKVGVNLPGIGNVSKPMTKLIDAVSKMVGDAFDPEKIKARAEARGAAMVTKTKAEIHAMELRERAQERLRQKEGRRQENIEAIVAKAIPALPDRVGEKEPEEDWVHQFFENCEDKGDEDIQQIWARILAGEIAKPGTYSLLTLSILRNMRRTEADLFTKFCSFVWHSGNLRIPILDSEFSHSSYCHIQVLDLIRLESFGLIQRTGHVVSNEKDDYEIRYFGRPVRLRKSYTLEAGVSLTIAGEELAQIAGAVPDEAYFAKVLLDWKQYGVTNVSPMQQQQPDHPPA